jgi:transcription antitermination factor NusG
MSIFALQVRTGEEINAKALIKKFAVYYCNESIQDIYAFETFTQQIGKRTTKKLRTVVPGYIFVEIDMETMSSEIWHFLKQIPNVVKVFLEKIHEEEFCGFFETVQNEQHPENKPAIEVELEQRDPEEIIHFSNTARSKDEKIDWLQQLRENSTDALGKLDNHAKGTFSLFTKKDRTFLKMTYDLFKDFHTTIEGKRRITLQELWTFLSNHYSKG